MKILRINNFTREVERIYNNKYEISSREFDRDLVEKCCRGEIPSYGGEYTENGLIWRYMKDLPYLKPNFDFFDKCGYFQMQGPSWDNFLFIGMEDLSYKIGSILEGDMCTFDLLYKSFSTGLSENIHTNLLSNGLYSGSYLSTPFNDTAIVLLDITGKILCVYPDIKCIPNQLFNPFGVDKILKTPSKYDPVYNCYWVRYKDLFKVSE